jgi:integrase
LVRVPRTLPRILPPADADRLVASLRTHRDRAMVLAMLLAGLRRCEVLGLRLADVQVADRRLAVVEGQTRAIPCTVLAAHGGSFQGKEMGRLTATTAANGERQDRHQPRRT